MKNISIALLGIILTSSIISGVNAATYTCATHPIFLKASSFLTRLSNGDADVASKIKKASDAFSANTPAALTASDLGICDQYAGEQTCCSKKMVELFNAASVQSAAQIQKNGTAANKLIYALKKVLSAYSCSSSASSMTIDQFLANSALTKFKKYYDDGQVAKVSFSKVIAGMNRGALCSLCAGVDKIDGYYVDPDLQIEKANHDTLISALDTSFTQLGDVINNTTNLDGVLDELLTAYIGSCTSYKANIKTDIKTVYGMKNADKLGSDGEMKCSGLTVFGERSDCDSAQDGDPEVKVRADAYKPSNDGRVLRILEDVYDSDLKTSGGLKVFIPNSSDSQINAAGDYKVTWPVDDTNNNNSSTSTSVSRIHFAAITLFLVALVGL